MFEKCMNVHLCYCICIGWVESVAIQVVAEKQFMEQNLGRFDTFKQI